MKFPHRSWFCLCAVPWSPLSSQVPPPHKIARNWSKYYTRHILIKCLPNAPISYRAYRSPRSLPWQATVEASRSQLPGRRQSLATSHVTATILKCPIFRLLADHCALAYGTLWILEFVVTERGRRKQSWIASPASQPGARSGETGKSSYCLTETFLPPRLPPNELRCRLSM